MSTRQKLIKVMSGTTTTPSDEPNLDQIRSELQEKSLSSDDSDQKNTESSDIFPKLYVRDDGSIDWDGALQDREALKLFGSSVWARINGKDPNLVDEDEENPSSEGDTQEEKNGVRAKIQETESIIKLREVLKILKAELDDMEIKHTKLLNSAIPPTTPNPTVKMASISSKLRTEIKVSTTLLAQKKDAVIFATLNYELERVYTYLEADLGNTFSKGYIPLQDRLAVAEFGLLESQLKALNLMIDSGEVDSDVLQVIMEQMTDFKRRLGIDYYVNVNPTWDTEALKRWAADLLERSNEGLLFYVKGCKLLWNDTVFCAWLLNRAVQGYTLKPREVRTLRRTVSDIITFIPFVIILLIPLTPVGHVFVFGAIQRFYPDFFPSMFTERRQNLLQLYESTEYSEITIDESLRAKFLRVSEAIFRKLSGNDGEVKRAMSNDDDKKEI